MLLRYQRRIVGHHFSFFTYQNFVYIRQELSPM